MMAIVWAVTEAMHGLLTTIYIHSNNRAVNHSINAVRL